MFGGLAFLIDGKMSVSVSGRGGLLVRADPAAPTGGSRERTSSRSRCGAVPSTAGCTSRPRACGRRDSCGRGSPVRSSTRGRCPPSADRAQPTMPRVMGLRGNVCIVGIAERPAERQVHRHARPSPWSSGRRWRPTRSPMRASPSADVDGVVCAGDVAEASLFVPATVAEYCGWSVNFAERIDLGGATAVGMVWRAAAAVELGLCEVVVCATVGPTAPAGAGRSIRRQPARGVRRVEHGMGFAAGGVRRALRQRGAERRLRDVRAALPRSLRMGRARTGEDRVRPARQRVRQPVGGLPRSARSASTTSSRRG